MEKLTPHQRDLIACRYTPGRSLTQFAETNGGTPGGLRISLMRIRSALKRCLEDQGLGGHA